MKPYISSGNRKMTLPTFSLPSKQTCPGCTALCLKTCYAAKAERAYPQVLPCRKNNLKASKLTGFTGQMIEAIKAKGKQWFRIHESGDFYSQWYLDKWIAIAKALPEVKFLAFTKSFHLDYSKLPKNLVVIWSVFPDTDKASIPPGTRAYAGEYKPRRKTLECPGNCDSCLVCWGIHKLNLDVHFQIH